MKKRLYLSPPHMGGNEIEMVKRVFESNWIAPVGPDITAFEEEMCAYTGTSHAVALASGTAALHLALQLCGVRSGMEVLCSTFTFAGSVFPVCYCNAEPVFIDSEAESWNMDPVLLEAAITDRIAAGRHPAAVIVVHLYGQSANIAAIAGICQQYGIPLIEDAAESVGAFFGTKHTGTFGRFGVFSFNGNKIMTTSGGGMLIGAHKEEIDKARFLSTQAREDFPHYEHVTIGYNYRMSNVLAAIGRGQLAALELHRSRRQAIFELYKQRFCDVQAITMMPVADWGRPNYWLTCIQINHACSIPEIVRQALEAENIESRPLWKPMHLQPVFKGKRAYCNGTSEHAFTNGLCLPSGSAMSDADVERVAQIVIATLDRC